MAKVDKNKKSGKSSKEDRLNRSYIILNIRESFANPLIFMLLMLIMYVIDNWQGAIILLSILYLNLFSLYMSKGRGE